MAGASDYEGESTLNVESHAVFLSEIPYAGLPQFYSFHKVLVCPPASKGVPICNIRSDGIRQDSSDIISGTESFCGDWHAI